MRVLRYNHHALHSKKRRFISLSLSQTTLREEEEQERLESVRVRVTFVRAAVWARARAGVLKRKK